MFRIAKIHLVFLATLWLLVHLAVYFHSGIRTELYDARGYIKSAGYFLEHGHFQVSYQFFYSLPILLIALCLKVFSEGVIAFVMLQCLLSAVATLAIYQATTMLFKNSIAGLFSAVIFLCWWDAIQWNTTVMTESVALSITCFILYAVTRFRSRVRDYLILAFLLFLCIITRPTGTLVMVGIVAFVLTKLYQRGQKPGFAFVSVISFIALVFLGMIMLQYWDFTEQYEKGNIVTYMDHIEGQRLYSESMRMPTRDLSLPPADGSSAHRIGYFISRNPAHFGKAFILKVGYLLSGIRPYYSGIHNVYSVIWLGLIYVLCYFGYRATGDAAVRNFIMVIIIANCFLVGIATVDWDNRFYLPMQPGIVLLAGGGAAYLLTLTQPFFLKKRNPSSE